MVIPALTLSSLWTVLPLFQPSAGNAQNIIDAGGTGTDNTSIWLVWGENTVHGIFPKGQKAGIQMEDKGRDTGRC